MSTELYWYRHEFFFHDIPISGNSWSEISPILQFSCSFETISDNFRNFCRVPNPCFWRYKLSLRRKCSSPRDNLLKYSLRVTIWPFIWLLTYSLTFLLFLGLFDFMVLRGWEKNNRPGTEKFCFLVKKGQGPLPISWLSVDQPHPPG